MALQIRQSTYRNQEGFTVTGRVTPDQSWPVSIFTRSRVSAEKIRDRIKAGEEIRPRIVTICVTPGVYFCSINTGDRVGAG